LPFAPQELSPFVDEPLALIAEEPFAALLGLLIPKFDFDCGKNVLQVCQDADRERRVSGNVYDHFLPTVRNRLGELKGYGIPARAPRLRPLKIGFPIRP